MDALLPCPFCGGVPELRDAASGRQNWAECQAVDCHAMGPNRGTPRDAITGWNRRMVTPLKGDPHIKTVVFNAITQRLGGRDVLFSRRDRMADDVIDVLDLAMQQPRTPAAPAPAPSAPPDDDDEV